MGNNAKKANQLGMPYGTATNKLRKAILFSLICRLGENRCFQCGNPINAIEDFSIEHMTPWQGADDPRAAFFDVKNISYSHIKCNISASSKPWKKWSSEKEGRRMRMRRRREDPAKYSLDLARKRKGQVA